MVSNYVKWLNGDLILNVDDDYQEGYTRIRYEGYLKRVYKKSFKKEELHTVPLTKYDILVIPECYEKLPIKLWDKSIDTPESKWKYFSPPQ